MTPANKITVLCLLMAANSFGGSIELIYRGTLPEFKVAGFSYSSLSFQLGAIADTDNRIDTPDGFFLQHTEAWLEIPIIFGNLRQEVFTATGTFVHHSTQLAGFSNAQAGAELIHINTNTSFATWDIASSIGPFSGGSSQPEWAPGSGLGILTAGGFLEVTPGPITNFEFFAQYDGDGLPGPIPEPAPALLMVASGVLLCMWKKPGWRK